MESEFEIMTLGMLLTYETGETQGARNNRII